MSYKEKGIKPKFSIDKDGQRKPDIIKPFTCATCLLGFATENSLFVHIEEHPTRINPERIFFFASHDGRLIPLNDKHALVLGIENKINFKEYLGMIETADPRILNKTIDEIREMNLPKVMPIDKRKVLFRGGREVSYNSLSNRI